MYGPTKHFGTTPYRLVFGKNCHFPVEIEHKEIWVLKTCNFRFHTNRLMQMNALKEIRNEVYTKYLIYKEKNGMMVG